MESLRMVPVASASAFEARVLAARLGSEGIVWQLTGGVDPVYPVGEVVVLVAEQDVVSALAVLEGDTELSIDLMELDGSDPE